MCNNRVRRRNKTLSADEFYGSDSTWLSGLMLFKIIIAHVIRMNTINDKALAEGEGDGFLIIILLHSLNN